MFIDSHCHLDFECFGDDLTSLLAELKKKHINKVIIPATQGSRWDKIEELARQHNAIHYALGIHPHFLDSFHESDLPLLQKKLSKRDSKCVALGEVGLDKFAKADQSQQEFVFIKQLKMAQQLQLPIILHCVKKQGRVLALLKQHAFSHGGVYHAFSGSIEVAHEFIKLGFKLGIGGVITYPNSTKTRQTISQLPIESLLLETDAPDMPLYQQLSEHNNPLNIIAIFNALSGLRNESQSQLMAQLYNNVINIFPLSND